MIFITGASGFVGKSVQNYLIKNNYEVIPLNLRKDLSKLNISFNKSEENILIHTAWDGVLGKDRNNQIQEENLNNTKVEFVINGPRDELSTAKLIKIAIFMPKIGKGIKNIEDLNKNNYAWTTFPVDEIILNKGYEVVANNEILYPWKLIYKK